MAGPARKKQTAKVNAAERRMRVAQLACEGKSQRDIARELRVDQGTISRDQRRVRREWREQASDNYRGPAWRGTRTFGTHSARSLGWLASVGRRLRGTSPANHRERRGNDRDETRPGRRPEVPAGPTALSRTANPTTLGLGGPETRERASREREGRAPVVEIIISNREEIPQFLDYSEFEARQVAPVQIEGESSDEIDYAD